MEKKKEAEITVLNLDDLEVEDLEKRLELAVALPSWCCSDCSKQCVGNGVQK